MRATTTGLDLTAPLRTDALGIFVVLAISGLSQLQPEPPTFVQQALPTWALVGWSGTLIGFGTLGAVATLLPSRRIELSLTLEVAARIALGVGALVEAVIIWVVVGAQGRFIITTYLGISALLLVGAALILRRLLHHRRALRTLATLTAE